MIFAFRLLLFFFQEELRVLLRYSRSLTFLKMYLLMTLSYLWKGPYRLSRLFLQAQGAKLIYRYGETPLTTFDRICKEAELQSEDVLYELGCGAGKTVFFAALFIGCEAFGVDILPTFIEKAEKIRREVALYRAHFEYGNMLQVDLQRATAIYLYGSDLEDEVIGQLIVNLAKTSPGTKIITVSYPLTDFTQEPLFQLVKSWKGRFPWGSTPIYLQKRV